MFGIGEFASAGRVSVRMLRHYDALGLLRPARVDAATGYRMYEARQLSRLNRIVALKELGFTLAQVQRILDEKVDTAQLHGMLRLRQAELESQIAMDSARLRQVEARIRSIEREGAMPAADVQVKRVPAVRVAESTALAPDFEPESIGPVAGPLFSGLAGQLDAAGVAMTGAAIAYYDVVPDGILVHAAFPVVADFPGPDFPAAECPGFDFTVLDLPGFEQAATIVHHGPMSEVMPTGQALARWIDENGYRQLGLFREVYLEVTEDQRDWVTELQAPVRPT
jgi:DNA-binding transcriptional MerR regulator